ncbi:trehalose-phosphatase (plasmid) [Tistrella mobilis]|uniref:trehalose-phosphatase n=1 Tax=Tistrella mobilis TaxID=171437 RepID=UPI00355878B1
MAALRLPDPRPDWALFLDVDGCLVDIAPTPDAVVVEPGLPALLDRLTARFGGALALVSGRPLAELEQLFHPARPAAAGQHGLEWRGRPPLPRPEGFEALDAPLQAFAEAHPGVLLERKSHGFALHYRAAPAAGAGALALACRLAATTAPELRVMPGKMVVELRMAGADKGTAIRAFMEAPPFRGRVPVFAGDDVTDEDGFAMVNAMGGHSIRVGPDIGTGHGAPPASAARWTVPDAPGFRRWLAGLVVTDEPAGEGAGGPGT